MLAIRLYSYFIVYSWILQSYLKEQPIEDYNVLSITSNFIPCIIILYIYAKH